MPKLKDNSTIKRKRSIAFEVDLLERLNRYVEEKCETVSTNVNRVVNVAVEEYLKREKTVS